MKAYELLILNKSLLQMMGDASLDVGDVKYIPVYQEYVRLSKEGHKKTYIMQYLSDEYNIAERTIYRIIDKFSFSSSRIMFSTFVTNNYVIWLNYTLTRTL